MAKLTLLVVAVMVWANCVTAGFAAPLALKDPWPEFALPTPQDQIQRYYLGLAQKADFSVADIKTEFVLVQIFSMYCPICQREAPRVNRLYEAIDGRDDLRGRLKIIGIGAGNSVYEVDFYRRNYGVAFPLFADGEYEIHQLLGEVGTPHFFLLRNRPGHRSRIVFIKSGGFKSAKAFLTKLLKTAGLNR